MKKLRLDQALLKQGLVVSRSQAESYIKLGKVKVGNQVITKPGYFVSTAEKLNLNQDEQYASRAGLKLASAAPVFNLDFREKVVLDVGSSTGGFTDFALKHGAVKVIAVDVGTNQLHPSLLGNKKIELHEKTDIRNFKCNEKIDITVVDVSFISLRDVLPAVAKLCTPDTQVIVLAKPQFEAGKTQVNKGIVKNDTIRRKILSDLEVWIKKNFVIVGKADSEIAGAKGNHERFYKLSLNN